MGPSSGGPEVAVFPLPDRDVRGRACVKAHASAQAGVCTTDQRNSVFTARIKNERET